MTSRNNIQSEQIASIRQLAEARRLIPFLGAGFSVPLGLPSWQQLVDFIAKELGYDPRVFQAEGTLPQLVEYYLLEKGRVGVGTLRSNMDRWFNDPRVDISTSRAHELLVKLNAPLVYTTNYDNWLEQAYEASGRPYHLIATIDDIANAEPGVSQIVKLHGSLLLDDTLVLSETHYFDRLGFESPLDIKLRSDILGRSLLFIGYSFQDINVRLMWYRLMKLWDSSSRGRNYSTTSYFVGFGVGHVQRKILSERFGITTIELDPVDKTASVAAFLEELT